MNRQWRDRPWRTTEKEAGLTRRSSATGGRRYVSSYLTPTVKGNNRDGAQFVPRPAGWVGNPSSQAERVQHSAIIGVDAAGHRDLADGQVRILQTVAGEDAHDGGSRRRTDLQEAGHRGG